VNLFILVHAFDYESRQLCTRPVWSPRLGKKTERLQTLERDMEQQKKQHSVTVDNLLLQTQNLETALKNERLVIVEERWVQLDGESLIESSFPFFIVTVVTVTYNPCCSSSSRRKLAQLQHAYTCLFQDYDNKLKSDKQANHRVGSCCLCSTMLVMKLDSSMKNMYIMNSKWIKLAAILITEAVSHHARYTKLHSCENPVMKSSQVKSNFIYRAQV